MPNPLRDSLERAAIHSNAILYNHYGFFKGNVNKSHDARAVGAASRRDMSCLRHCYRGETPLPHSIVLTNNRCRMSKVFDLCAIHG
jgi:hypothetical protein